jgi:hypothetical protein
MPGGAGEPGRGDGGGQRLAGVSSDPTNGPCLRGQKEVENDVRVLSSVAGGYVAQ